MTSFSNKPRFFLPPPLWDDPEIKAGIMSPANPDSLSSSSSFVDLL